MNNKKIKRLTRVGLIIFIGIIISYCRIYSSEEFYYWHGAIKKMIELNKGFIVKGRKHIELLQFGKKLNEKIINDDVDGLLEYISKDDFRFYSPIRISDNISNQLRNDLITRNGYYYFFLFNKSKLIEAEG